METKMDGVKTTPKARTKSTGVKRPRKSEKSQSAPEILEKKERSKNKAEANNNLLTVLPAVLITAVVIGGVIYAWQGSRSSRSIEQAKNEASDLKSGLEKQLDELKSKLNGTLTENEQLKTTNEELGKKAEILNKAYMTFANEELGISFDYPASFGQVKLSIENGKIGKHFVGTFTDNDKLVFGGASTEFAAATTSDEALLETRGYKEIKKKFYYVLPGKPEDDLEITPVKTVESGGNKMLLVNKNSFSRKDVVSVGENLAALVNLKSKEFSGIAFIDKDFGLLPQADFEKLLKTIIIK